MAVSAINFGVTISSWYNKLETSDFLSMIEMIREDEQEKGTLSFVHAHEWSIGLMMYYFPEANHYTSDETWCVLVDYSLNPAECINIGSFSDIGDFEKEAYFFDWEIEDSTGLQGRVLSSYFTADEYAIEDLGYYYEPYTYKGCWHLEKVIRN